MRSFSTSDPAPVATMVQQAFAASNDLLIVTDNSFTIHFVSNASTALLGRPPGDLVGTNGIDLVHPEDAVVFLNTADQVAHGYVPQIPGLFRAQHADGSYRLFEVHGGPFTDGGEIAGFWVVARPPLRTEVFNEVLRRVLANEPLVAALESVPRLLAEERDRVFISCWGLDEPDFTVGPDSDALLNGSERPAGSPWALACETRQEVFGNDLSGLSPDIARRAQAAGLGSYVIVPIRGIGEEITAVLTMWTASVDAPAQAAARTMGVRELVQAAIAVRHSSSHLSHLARSDSLTGLGNRLAFQDSLDVESLAGASDSAIFYIDLDYFKDVNDAHGHATGDAVLQAAAARITASVRAHDVVARIGGDEFAVLCRGCGESEASELAERILVSLRQPVQVADVAVEVRASVGVATGHTDRNLLGRADAALYEAKRSGRNAVRFSTS